MIFHPSTPIEKKIVIIQMKLFQFVLRIKFKRENDPRSSDAILSCCEKKNVPPWYWFALLPIEPLSPNWNFCTRIMIRLLNRNGKHIKVFLVLNVWLRSLVGCCIQPLSTRLGYQSCRSLAFFRLLFCYCLNCSSLARIFSAFQEKTLPPLFL